MAVTPRILPGKWRHQSMHGAVSSSFANVTDVETRSGCPKTITTKLDPREPVDTCMHIDQAGQAYVSTPCSVAFQLLRFNKATTIICNSCRAGQLAQDTQSNRLI